MLVSDSISRKQIANEIKLQHAANAVIFWIVRLLNWKLKFRMSKINILGYTTTFVEVVIFDLVSFHYCKSGKYNIMSLYRHCLSNYRATDFIVFRAIFKRHFKRIRGCMREMVITKGNTRVSSL